jgi:2-dehydropantoate 2-reductase
LTFERILVLGAGAMGSIYGAFLSRKNDVTLIGNKTHVESINSSGLRITGDANETIQVKAETEIYDIPRKALIILTTKAYDSEKAINGIRKLFKKDTIVLILQNGLGNEEVVKHVVGEVKVVRGVTKMAAEFFKPGEIKFWNGETVVEPSDASTEIAKILNECGLRARVSEHIDREIWTKLVVNCVINPLTALFRVRNCEIWGDSLKNVRQGIVSECLRVAEAEGIALNRDIAERMDNRVSSYTNFSSMYQDIIKGKKTEIDFLNGRIVELGKKHRVPTPFNETLVSFIKFLEGKNGIPRRD